MVPADGSARALGTLNSPPQGGAQTAGYPPSARAEPSAGTIRGFLVAWRVGDELEILFVATGPGFRRRGVGRMLVAAAVDGARGEGAARVVLEVARRNEGARRLYEAMGFREEGGRRGYYADGDDAVLMGRSVEP
ncbi:MAG TPA: GNAT family N-acetyltransferase [Polyangiaceae bacterium]|nr:GNAT family N-acetyltransferase [Polyangiaceae bacterium]